MVPKIFCDFVGKNYPKRNNPWRLICDLACRLNYPRHKIFARTFVRVPSGFLTFEFNKY